MKRAARFGLAGPIAVLVSGCVVAGSGQWHVPNNARATAASDVCSNFALLSGSGPASAGFTNGISGVADVGETYTISVSGPGTGSFRLVGDSSGTITYAGPASVPGTLTYTFTSPPSPSAEGVGFYFDSGSGQVTITASCAAAMPAATAVPSLSLWGMLVFGLLLVLGALLMRFRGVRNGQM